LAILAIKKAAMRETKMKKAISNTHLLLALMLAATLFLTPATFAAAPGISSTAGTPGTFLLTAQDAYLNQPDGAAVYSWGYGCVTGSSPSFLPSATFAFKPACNTMQVPGPTLIVTEGSSVTVNLTNNLPTAAGNTSILFPGFVLTSTCPNTAANPQGLLTCEAAPGATVTYTFTATAPGTHAYYSGTQGDLQIEMGLYGAIIVLPATAQANCANGTTLTNLYGKMDYGTASGTPGFPEQDFRLATSAYDHPKSCYDREYLFQWAEMDARIHQQAQAQVLATAGCTAGTMGCSLNVQTEPYHPSYFLINGRSMPDLMDPNYASEYPHQPYNGNPHIHPGEQMLIRTIGQGRWQHPYHEHANHVRILARDGNLILSPTNPTKNLAGILMFNTDTTPGEAFDGIFYFTGRGLNWDPYGHHPGADVGTSPDSTGNPANDPLAHLSCTADANGYNTGTPSALNYYEWCQDHDKPVQVAPFGDVATGGPATLPDPNILTNGQWYGGTPYLGPDASLRATMPTCVSTAGTGTATPATNCTTLLPSNTQANPQNERGWAFMWHSHNEREITTNNVFPGGMLMMLLVDSREFAIDESL
jgi:FtsP/CotA-like multicopper oxidase with cupredoxin domain